MTEYFINSWKVHPKKTLPGLQLAYTSGVETGNLSFAGYGASRYCTQSYWASTELIDLDGEMSVYSELLRKIQQKTSLNYILIARQAVLNLLGKSQERTRLIGECYDEEVMLTQHQQAGDRLALFDLLTHKLTLSYLFEEIQGAISISLQLKTYLDVGTGLFIPAFYFYQSLACLRVILEEKNLQQQQILDTVAENQAQLKKLAEFAPTNNQHKFDLIEAECYRVQRNFMQAMESYDRAIAGAKANGYIQEEALSNELAAKFYLDRGKEKVAAGYMQEAYYCYAQWGSLAKTDDLEQRYPDLLRPILQKTAQTVNPLETLASLTTHNRTSHSATTSKCSSSNSLNDALDFAAILKASQLLSSTIQLDDLLHQLTKIILQNSGAERCALIVPNFHEEWELQANATPGKVELLKEAIDTHPNLPVKLIQYVKRTQEVVVIESLKTDLPIIDKYLSQQQPKSVLCLPILDRGQLRGILYLENRSTRGVFGSDRILVLNFLCTQAAISLENARLHAREQEKSHRLEQSQERLKLIVQQTPLIVIEWNTRFEVQTWNPAAEKAFGYRREEVFGQHFRFIIPEENRSYVDDIARQILTQHGGTHAINENVTKDGQRFICEWFNAPMIDVTGQVLGGISVALDISDRKRAETAVIQKTQELEQTLQELQNAQLQIVQSEKMASLGNLVAGVAHEINNPIGFLHGSINNAKDYVRDLLKHLTLYQQYCTQAPEAIQNHADDIDLEFLSEDLLKLLDSMKGATDRITSISTSLRTFSRADAQYKVSANLHDGIDSTLLILKYRLKANESRPAIDIIKEYGELPQISCFPSQINQVFMNILANAIDVFDEMAQTQSFVELLANPQQIAIYTKALEDRVEIRICDNGKGMTEEVSAKIFDHLFTTKAIGKGTGLGLAIARQIVVDKHNGELRVHSTPGQGTEFTILLPVKE